MEFVPVQRPLLDLPVILWVVIAVVLLLVIGGLIEVIAVNTKKYQTRDAEKQLPASFGISAMLVGAVGVLLISPWVLHDGPRAHQQNEAKVQIQNAYGVSFESPGFGALDYPTTKPQADFEVYGPAKITVRTGEFSFKKTEVYLVWSDGKFGLAKSPDGKRFNQMPLENGTNR